MKYTTFSMLLVCFFVSAYGQLPGLSDPDPSIEILNKQIARRTAQKTTDIQKRLIARSVRISNTTVDSTHFYYSKRRGSVNTPPRDIDDFYWPENTDLVINMWCDSSVRWLLDFSNNLERRSAKYYTYDAQDKITTLSIPTPAASEYTHTYNAQGQVSKIVISNIKNNTPLQPKEELRIAYDANRNRIYDSSYILAGNNHVRTRSMQYDAKNNRILLEIYGKDNNNNWIIGNRNIYIYDANNRLTIAAFMTNQNGILENNAYDSFAYSGSNVYPSYYSRSSWDKNNNSWKPGLAISYTLNSKGLTDTYEQYQWNTQKSKWDTTWKYEHIYDATGTLLLEIKGYEYQGGVFSSTAKQVTTFYFEEYYPESIAEAGKDTGNMLLYPNPADNTLHISFEYPVTGDVVIYDETGKAVYSKQVNAARRLDTDIEQLPPGNYYLMSIDRVTNKISKGRFVKLHQ